MICGCAGVPIGLSMAEDHESLHGGTIPRPSLPGPDDNDGMPLPAVESLDIQDGPTARAVLSIQRAAYRVEADLVGFDGIPPLHETLDDLVSRPLTWLGVRSVDGVVVAALGYTERAGHVDIDRLVVAPDHFRHGMASALVGALDPRMRITVATGTANRPAHRLYEAHGFAQTGDEMIAPGLSITHFEREGTA